MSKFCPKCGAELPDDSMFCDTCGANLGDIANGSADSTPPAQNLANTQATDASGPSRQPQGTQGSFPSYGKTGSYNASVNGSPQSGNTFGNSAPQQNVNFNNPNKGSYGGPQPNGFNGPAPGGPYNPNNGTFNGPNTPGGGKNSGGIPKVAFIGAGVLGLVVIGAVAALLLKSKGTDVVPESNGSIQSVSVSGSDTEPTNDASPVINGYEETTAASAGSSSGLSDSDQEALDTAMKVLSGNVSGDDKDIVKIPSGAKVKDDAKVYDLIGEYEGEIQLTALDGFENIDGVPSDFGENRKEALSKPLSCTLTIDDDGDWELEYDFMGGMGMDSSDFHNSEDFTAQQREDILVNKINGGYYHASLDAEGDIEGDKDAKIKLDHIGAYCTKGSDRLIAGYYYMHGTMYGAEITVCGDFNVKKMTEDVEPELENAGKGKSSRDDVPVFDENDPESMKYYGFDDDDDSDKSKTDSDDDFEEEVVVSTKKKSSAASETEEETTRTIPTISGGQWSKLKSGLWIYEKNGRLVKDVWVEDKGKYYYIDEEGYMMTDGYTPDGYYVKSDGSWDSSISQKKSGSSENLPDGVDDYDPTTYAVTGGEFEDLGDDIFMYKDSKGKYVRNTWVMSKGKCYFIGPDGARINNNYASDGFWAGDNGKWDEDVAQRNSDPEPLNKSYAGSYSTWKIKLLKNGTYGTATQIYDDGGDNEVYTLTPLGHGVYLAELEDDSLICALMSVSDDQKKLIVSQVGTTEECKVK